MDLIQAVMKLFRKRNTNNSNILVDYESEFYEESSLYGQVTSANPGNSDLAM